MLWVLSMLTRRPRNHTQANGGVGGFLRITMLVSQLPPSGVVVERDHAQESPDKADTPCNTPFLGQGYGDVKERASPTLHARKSA